MFTEETVLVLGAGASEPYGFPLGNTLLREIVKNVRATPLEFLPGTPYVPDEDEVVLAMERFADKLLASGQGPIDAFLQRNRQDEQLRERGKFAVAKILMEKEDHGFLIAKEGEWYQHLWHFMDDAENLDVFGENKLSIITYNYDRSLEHYLHTALTNSYGASPKQACEQQLSQIPVIHLHGSLGRLPWQDKEPGTGPVREYVPDAKGKGAINAASKAIQILDEVEAVPSRQFQRAHKCLLKAKHIYVLGFGYDPENVKRLKPPEGQIRAPVQGTCLGFSGQEARELALRMNETFAKQFTLAGGGEDTMGFLRNVTFV